MTLEATFGPLQMHFQWLPPISANLAELKVAVPAGFQQVPPLTQK